MKSNILSFGIVGIWENIKSSIPILGNEFCKDLFGDVYNTITGMTEEGFLISLPSSRLPVESVIIHHQRIQFITHDFDRLLDISSKVIGQLDSLKDFSTSVRAIGFNTEFEISDIGAESSSWISNKFINSNEINKQFPENILVTKDLKFDVLLSDDKKVGLILQPRVGRPDAIYLKINFHKGGVPEKYPDSEKIKKMYNESSTIFEKQIASLFNK